MDVCQCHAIHKKGSRSYSGNYRPICLTSVVYKTIEILVKGKKITHLEGNNLIVDSQHGFRNKPSCLTNLLDYFARVINTCDSVAIRQCTESAWIFKKVFDKVPLERLLVKVMAHGIQGSAAQWIGNWLAGRRHRVCIIQTYNSWTQDTSNIRWPTEHRSGPTGVPHQYQ